MNKLIISMFLFFFINNAQLKAQNIHDPEIDELEFYADVMTNASEISHRKFAAKKFEKSFIKALEQPSSFKNTFENIKAISIKNDPENNFRVITWGVLIENDQVNYYGMLQKKTDHIIQFKQSIDPVEGMEYEEMDSENWLGARYNDIVEVKESKNFTYYLLLGTRQENEFEKVKIVDVLFFTNDGVPYFGKPVFKVKEETNKNRLVLRHAADAFITLTYNPSLEMIITDNLVKRMSRIPGQGQTMVPDGSFIGYKLKNNVWVQTDIEKEMYEEEPPINNKKSKSKQK